MEDSLDRPVEASLGPQREFGLFSVRCYQRCACVCCVRVHMLRVVSIQNGQERAEGIWENRKQSLGRVEARRRQMQDLKPVAWTGMDGELVVPIQAPGIQQGCLESWLRKLLCGLGLLLGVRKGTGRLGRCVLPF